MPARPPGWPSWRDSKLRFGSARTAWAAAALALAGGAAVLAVEALGRSTRFQLLGALVTRVDTPRRAVALTFDDGPNPPWTERILEVLARRRARATFFVVGWGARAHLPLLRRMLAEGHELGNHSYSHLPMMWRTPNFIRAEIDLTDAILAEAGAPPPYVFRAPFGRKFLLLPLELARRGRTHVLWDVAPESPESVGAEAAVQTILAQAQPGSIVLLHDGGPAGAATVEATERAADELQRRGFELVTVSELLR